MHTFIKQILAQFDVHGSHGSAITLDDFGEGELQQRYAKLFELPSHYVYVLSVDLKATKVANWAEFMNWVRHSNKDISSVIAVPINLVEQIEALAAAA